MVSAADAIKTVVWALQRCNASLTGAGDIGQPGITTCEVQSVLYQLQTHLGCVDRRTVTLTHNASQINVVRGLFPDQGFSEI